MNSLSPEEIEDVEIVKGPSAATLYGTDAANGVIVVTTKKGRAGSSRWNWFASTQRVEDRNNYPATYALWGHNPTTGKVARCELATMTPTTCVVDSTTSFDLSATPGITPIANGMNTNYGGQVSGGSDAVRYFVSGDLFNEVGPYKMPSFAQQWLADTAKSSVRDEWIHPEAFQRQNMRANVSASVSPEVRPQRLDRLLEVRPAAAAGGQQRERHRRHDVLDVRHQSRRASTTTRSARSARSCTGTRDGRPASRSST